MRVVKILALIFFVTTVLFVGAQIVNRIIGVGENLTLLALWLRLSASGPTVLRSVLPDGVAQDILTALLATPAWLASLCLGGFLWLIGRFVGDDD